mmetsp:Transcript_47091/g.84836  ORF Transcript_47091/g.84836 Transcript_47091/m.84836 type:complete len:87 (-) Transcript_47091:82-342(-)
MDDSASASDLRRRMQAGGLKDDQLSASQVRARYGIQLGTGSSRGMLGEKGMSPAHRIRAITATVIVLRRKGCSWKTVVDYVLNGLA